MGKNSTQSLGNHQFVIDREVAVLYSVMCNVKGNSGYMQKYNSFNSFTNVGEFIDIIYTIILHLVE